jgi:hypothetical protein
MAVPSPTPILRFLHVDNLHIYLQRGGIHAPNFTPNNGLEYQTIHNEGIQQQRRSQSVPCGPCGAIHDYVPFYFGYLSPMMLQLKSGRVDGYNEGQDPLIYLISTAQAVRDSGIQFVFSDGHGIATFTEWFDDLAHLDQIDWSVVYERYWRDTDEDMDRQRRKQAEFLVYKFCPWSLIHEIGVIDNRVKSRVEDILAGFPKRTHRSIRIRREWYYY